MEARSAIVNNQLTPAFQSCVLQGFTAGELGNNGGTGNPTAPRDPSVIPTFPLDAGVRSATRTRRTGSDDVNLIEAMIGIDHTIPPG